MKARLRLPSIVAAATATALYDGVLVAAANDTVITYPGAGVQWNSSDLFHNIVWDVNKIPSGYLEDATLELHHKDFTKPMNLASKVNVTQCHRLIPVPAVDDSDAYQVVMVVNYPLGTLPDASGMEADSATGVATAPTVDASAASSPAAGTSTIPTSSTSIAPSSPTTEGGLQGVRRRHAMPNPYPNPDAASVSVTTITSLTTTTTTVQASGAYPSTSLTVDESAAFSSAAAALSSASAAMASASAAMESVSAAMPPSAPTSGLESASAPGSAETSSNSGGDSGSTATILASLDGSAISSGTNPASGTMDGEGGTPTDAPAASSSGTATAGQTTSTSFVGAYFAIHQNTVSTTAPSDATPTLYALD